MHEDNCAVYVHVNLINGKKYFGITTLDPEKRWRNGNGYYNNTHFMSAIKKYGWDNFGHFVLYKNIPIKIAKNIEEMLIREHMSYDRRYGYNKTYGGELEIPTEEARKKMSDSSKGKTPTEKTRRKISEANRGRVFSEETRKKLSDMKPKKSIEAIDPETGLRAYYFESIMNAERSGFQHGNIIKCCRGERHTHKGFYWRYIEEVDDDDSDN